MNAMMPAWSLVAALVFAAGPSVAASEPSFPKEAFGKGAEVVFVDRLPAGEGERFRAFLESGGVLIVRLVSSKDDYAGAAAFCGEKALPDFKAQKGAANDYDRIVQPGGTRLFEYPNRISPTLRAGNGRLSLPGEARGKWEVVQHGYTVLHRVERGLLIVSTHTVADTKELREDIARQLAFEEDGLRFVDFLHDYAELEEYMGRVPFPALGGGKTVLKVKNVNEATTNLNLALRVVFSERRSPGRSRTFLVRAKESRKIGEVVKLELDVPPLDLNGPCSARTELVSWGGGKTWTIEETEVEFPELLEVLAPSYRGWVSTRRRQADVILGLRINRGDAEHGGGRWRMVAKDADGDVAAEASGRFEANSRKVMARLPLPKDAPAGEYEIEAEAEIEGLGDLRAKGAMRVVAPVKGQIMADQDGFWLQEGEPYFPLGIYHCHTFDWPMAIDDTGLRACDMGFNWMQLWEWDWRSHLSLDRRTLSEFVKKGLVGKDREDAIDALVEENKRNREMFKGVAICYEGFNIWNDCMFERPGEWGRYSFETDERLPREVKLIAEDPDQLVRMWYFSDEAGGNFHRALSRGARRIAEFDTAGYPTFNLGNLPAVMAGDVGGNDIYVRYYGGLGSAASFAQRVDSIRRELRPFGRRPFIVPQAFGQSKSQSTETPEWVRIETYLSVIHGACGIGFYCWKQTGDWSGSQKQGMGWNPKTAHEVKRLIAEVKTFQAALMSGETRLLKSDDGNIHALLCGNEASGRFLVAANTLELPVETELPVPGLSKMELAPLFGSPAAKRAGGFLGIGCREALAVSLPAWGTCVWRVE